MKILFLHQNFPGQYKHLMPYCKRRGHEVMAMGNRDASRFPTGFPYRRYVYDRSTGRDTDPLAIDVESKFIRARSCANAAKRLRDEEGFRPDVICAHTGWGEELFLHDVWPEARILGYCEYYYNAEGFDMGFDPEYSGSDPTSPQKLRAKNATILVSLEQLAAGVCPTRFQWSSYPGRHRSHIRVIHDGIDTQHVRPMEDVFVELRGRRLTRADPVVTFVSRSLEPARGFHRFMRALPRFQELCPEAHVIIVGTSEGGYGAKPQVPWKDQLLQELEGRINHDRLYFPGRVPYADFLRLLAISRCHVYFTIPFVLSWSLMESMASGCVVVGSATAPVQEVIEHGVNGLLVDYFDSEALAVQMAAVVDQPAEFAHLGDAARQTIVREYERSDCLARHHTLIEAVAYGLA